MTKRSLFSMWITFKLLFVLSLLALLATAAKADTISLTPTGPVCAVNTSGQCGTGGNLNYGVSGPTGLANTYTWTPLGPDYNACVYLWNASNGLAATPSVSLTVGTSPDPNGTFPFSAQSSGVGLSMSYVDTANNQLHFVTGIGAVSTIAGLAAANNNVLSFFFAEGNSSLIFITPATSGAAVSRSAEMVIVQTKNSSCSGPPSVKNLVQGSLAGWNNNTFVAGSPFPDSLSNFTECLQYVDINGLFGCPANVMLNYVFVGLNASIQPVWDKLRTPNVFKTCTATASGATACWTPVATKRFRLMGYCIDGTANIAQAAGGVVTVDLQDAATSTANTWSIFVPAAAGTVALASQAGCNYSMGNGFLSSAANNVLNVNLSSALTAGVFRVRLWGTEE